MSQLKSFVSTKRPELIQFSIVVTPLLMTSYIGKIKENQEVSEIESFFIFIISHTYQTNQVFKIPTLQKPSIYHDPILAGDFLHEKVCSDMTRALFIVYSFRKLLEQNTTASDIVPTLKLQTKTEQTFSLSYFFYSIMFPRTVLALVSFQTIFFF